MEVKYLCGELEGGLEDGGGNPGNGDEMVVVVE